MKYSPLSDLQEETVIKRSDGWSNGHDVLDHGKIWIVSTFHTPTFAIPWILNHPYSPSNPQLTSDNSITVICMRAQYCFQGECFCNLKGCIHKQIVLGHSIELSIPFQFSEVSTALRNRLHNTILSNPRARLVFVSRTPSSNVLMLCPSLLRPEYGVTQGIADNLGALLVIHVILVLTWHWVLFTCRGNTRDRL